MTEKKVYYYPLPMVDTNGFEVKAKDEQDRIRLAEFGFVPKVDKEKKDHKIT